MWRNSGCKEMHANNNGTFTDISSNLLDGNVLLFMDAFVASGHLICVLFVILLNFLINLIHYCSTSPPPSATQHHMDRDLFMKHFRFIYQSFRADWILLLRNNNDIVWHSLLLGWISRRCISDVQFPFSS